MEWLYYGHCQAILVRKGSTDCAGPLYKVFNLLRDSASGTIEVLLNGEADFLPGEFHVFVENPAHGLFECRIVGQRVGA